MPVIALNNTEHQKLRVSPPKDFGYLSEAHMLPLVVTECGHAGSNFPVVFVKDTSIDAFQLVALFGLQENENLFVDNGDWTGVYMPAIIQIAPFKMVSDPQRPDQLIVGLDTDDQRVSEGDGEALFDSEGGETEFLGRVKESLGHYYQNQHYTRKFIDVLSGLDLIQSTELVVRLRDEKTSIRGLHSIDEEKLNALTDEQFCELREGGFLPAVYAQMLSLNQVHRLAGIKQSG